MSSAVFGLLGVALGAALAMAKEWWSQRRSMRKEREYLAILVAFSLEKLGLECADIVFDDGLSDGQYDLDGCRAPQASTPSFNPKSLDVDWKSIPADLVYQIFNLVNEIDAANHRISLAYEYQAGAPDYEEYFEERQMSYAVIGASCFALADRLRVLGGLPKRDVDGWDPVEEMLARKKEAEDSKAQREARRRTGLNIAPTTDAQV
jgi:hypothetical protein